MALQEKTNKKETTKASIFGSAILAERTPVVAVLFDEKTSEGARGVIEGLEALGVHTVIVDQGEQKMHNTKKQNSEMQRAQSVDHKTALSSADIAVVFSSELVAQARKNGCVPVAPYINDKSTISYNPVQEKGNGFYFKNETKWEIFAAIVRALETFQFPYDWANVVKESRK